VHKNDPIVIIGGGIIGVSIAYFLRDTDRSVVLLEKESLGAGTTSESLANLGLNYPSPLSMRRFSRDHYFDLVDEESIGYEAIGGLIIKDTEAGFQELEKTAEDLDELGHETELLTPEEVREFGVDPPDNSKTLHIPDKGYLDPSEIIRYWADGARNEGVKIRTGTAAQDVHVENGKIVGVETDSETIRTGTVVNAAGQWAPAINDLVDITLPLRHNYGPILVLEVKEEISLPFVYLPNKQYFREEGPRSVFAGRRGVNYEGARRRDPGHARQVPESFYLDVQEQLETSILAVKDATVINEWQGMRTITPDNLPIVGESAVDGFYVACGASGKGITLAPAIGHDFARLLVEGDRPDALSKLNPARF